ncbi:VCBS repeat-containing protein [Sandaracinomonas limnophila]|uniref:VCBS repeat-containing protein n=1 Tax=Sandaracinomonas limnophila TaxID=1862386 RepID=A0A437PMV0_9BACT|nr:VCBS repeat-containing protein [Sandaracinomonas limnophila]RVU23623.1 VCBS repeat-containing protein [Sandaracinomonas limnophila]
MKILNTILVCSIFLCSCTKEIIQFKLTTNQTPINGGTVSPPSNSYEAGTVVPLIATPAGEYLFKGWTGSISSTNNTYSVTMDADKQVTAQFEKRQYPLNLTIEGNGKVKEEVISLATQSQYPSGTTVKLTASANIGSKFSEWSGDISSKDSIITSTITKPVSYTAKFVDIPMVPAINTDLFPDLNWNDHAAGKNGTYDFNNDGIPDIITYRSLPNNSILPAILTIKDYTGKEIFNFNLKDYKPSARDSLSNILIDFRDLNNDGQLDLGLSYMAEWWTGQNGAPGSSVKYIGNNIYLLLSKAKLSYDVAEILDEPNKPLSFNITMFDWDLDGKDDVLLSDLERGDYLKNLGNNKFDRKKLTPQPFKQGMGNKLDFDKDGKVDLINLYVNQMDADGKYTSSDMSQTLSVLTSKGVSHFPVKGKTINKYIYILGDIISAERIAMVDGDNDGDMDLIVGSLKSKPNAPWTYIQDYFENTGSRFEFRPGYIEIDESLIGELQVWTGDVDKDGDMDLYYPTYRKSQLNANHGKYFWWENTKNGFKINKNFYLKY